MKKYFRSQPKQSFRDSWKQLPKSYFTLIYWPHVIFNEISSVLKDLVLRNVRTKKVGLLKEKKSDIVKRKEKARKLAKERAEFAKEKN